MRRNLFATLLLAIAVALTAACASVGTTTSASAPAIGGQTASEMAKGAPAAANDAGKPASQGIPSAIGIGRDLILTANISMHSKDPWAVSDAARSIAAGLGGDLLGLSQSGSGDTRSATVTMRVPSQRFDDALAALKKLDGDVMSSNVNAKDVTDQLVDLQARLTATQAVETRYLQLLAQAKTVDEMLRVESALATTRTQIEQLKAQLKSMNDQVAFSTITMQISTIPVLPIEPRPIWDPSKTFERATAALYVLMRSLADLAIWLLVLGWIPLAALAVVFAATRVRASRVPTA